jgi:hypothetical protein
MTDPAQNLDDAKARLQAAAEPKPAKRSKASYAVLRLIEVDGEKDHLSYVLITEQVAASSRREAIKLATANIEEAMKSGDFLVIPSAQVQTIKRTTRTETVDEFS